ncbi:MAG: aminopeptidase N [Pacificimonas sp.]
MDILPADAQPAPHAPAVTRREDYRPPSWRVPSTTLVFNLDPERTKVTATLEIERGDGPPGPLVLDAEAMEILRVRVNGTALAPADWMYADHKLTLPIPGERATVETEVRIAPETNTQLMGLYASGGILCTQCEAEGFRRITPYPDRPDILSTYDVTLRADAEAFPVLLSNGDPHPVSDLGDGRHEARWTDPHPKPSYLFALVAGDLSPLRDKFTTMSGREVNLAIWVRVGDEPRCRHAMQALKDAMRWDEKEYGREYDLDVFNIVAVDDFNFGAMENKGLNIFNSKYVLADRETATDLDFDNIAGIVAHEYFHNWTGNRITCRDWFQLSLKEGLTVFRDQSFSADHGSAAVKRIQDVRTLRAAQFPEDSGPLAHPVRPDSYQEISNFYTATVYNKGAEVIRMMATMAGPDAYRRGTDLYFERHDGEAATCEDWVLAMEDGASLDLAQFRLWYAQAGTPVVTADLSQEGEDVVVTLAQHVPSTPGQAEKQPMHIPLKLALIGRQSGGRIGDERLIHLTEQKQQVRFEGVVEPALLSINRHFTAPVEVQATRAPGDLGFLAAHDDDPFARYEAMQALMSDWLVGASRGRDGATDEIVAAAANLVADEALDDAFKAEALTLPNDNSLIDRIATDVDPEAVGAARTSLKLALLDGVGRDEWRALYARMTNDGGDLSPAAKGARRLRGVALGLLFTDPEPIDAVTAATLYDQADNMTERMIALSVLADSTVSQRDEALADFHTRYNGNANVIDKWFLAQAMAEAGDPLARVQRLVARDDYADKNPNRFRAVAAGFAANLAGFHRADGGGYRFLSDRILAVDPINPQTAARFIAPLGRWRRLEAGRADLMRGELERLLATDGLSKDVREMAEKSLA